MRPASVLLVVALILGGTAYASSGGPRYERSVEVVETGWVRLTLDGRILAQGLPGERFRVVSPGGEAVPQSVFTPHAVFVKARTVSLDENDAGWSIVFDLGPSPVSHRRLEVDLIRRTSARDCRLEGSHDLETWSFLGEATLYRLGEGGFLHGSALDYERTDARYLRLRWPRAAGFPEIRDVGVRPLPHPPGDPVVVPVGLRAEDSEPGLSSYRLELPGPGLRMRTLVLQGLDGQRDHGYRLYRAVSQRWEVIASGVIPAGEAPEIGVGQMPGHSQLRLELYETGATLESAAVHEAPVWILFRADRAGTYALRYGGETVGTRPEIADLAAVGPVTDLRPEPSETVLPVPEIPSRDVEPVRGGDSEIARTRRAIVPAYARPGEVVRLAIPDELRRELGSNLWRLRVLAGDNEVPYVLWTSADPAPALEIRGLRPRPVRGERFHRVRIEGGEIVPLLSQIEVFVENGDLDSRVGLSFPREERPGVERRPTVLWSNWECGGSETLPCRAAFDGVPEETTGVVELLVEIRRDDPEPSLRVRAWTARPTLVFVLPETDDLTLARLHGRRVYGPHYRFGNHEASLLTAAWTPATLDLASERDARERREKLMRIALFVVLGVGAVVLLWILARNLRGAPSRAGD